MPEKIGGRGHVIKIDETAIAKGRIIKVPSHRKLETKIANIQWLVGGVLAKHPKKFFICLVPDRTAATMQKIL